MKPVHHIALAAAVCAGASLAIPQVAKALPAETEPPATEHLTTDGLKATGMVVRVLPRGAKRIRHRGRVAYLHRGVIYRPARRNGVGVFVVVR